MEESANEQISQPGLDDQVPPQKESGDDDQMTLMNPTGKSLLDGQIFITVARTSLNINIARLWVQLFKRIREPMALSLRTIQEFSLTEPKTAPLTVLTSRVSPGSDDDKTLAAQQRVQSCHLFIQQTLRNDCMLIPVEPPKIFADVTGAEVPFWKRLFPKILDLNMITARNHFAHNFGIPEENRPPNALSDPWKDDVIFQWVHRRYTYLGPVITTLLQKLEDAIDDEKGWRNTSDSHLLYSDEPSYRRDEEGAEPIWVKYLKEEEENRRILAEEAENLQKEPGSSWEQSAIIPEDIEEPAEAVFESAFEEERNRRLISIREKIVGEVEKTVGGAIDSAIEKIINKARDADSDVEVTAETIIQDVRKAIIKYTSDAIAISAIEAVPAAIESTISDFINAQNEASKGASEASKGDKEAETPLPFETGGKNDEEDSSI